MIRRETIDGRGALVAYLDGFTPVEADKATRIKIMYDDGDVVFAHQVVASRQLLVHYSRDATSGATQDHDPDTGQFVGDGGGGSADEVHSGIPVENKTQVGAKKTKIEKETATKTPATSAPLVNGDPRDYQLNANAVPTVYMGLVANTIKADEDKREPRSVAVPVVARELTLRARAIWQRMGVTNGMVEGPSPKTDVILADLLATEIKNGLTNGHSAVHWYNDKMKEARRIAALIHPAMKDDARLKFAFFAALAITSQGQTVETNASLTEQVYAEFEKTGRFPETAFGNKADSIVGNFHKLNGLLDQSVDVDHPKGNVEKVEAFLNSRFTVRDLEKKMNPGIKLVKDYTFTVSKTNKDVMVYGSSILGPKIGEGFYQNIHDNFQPLTADMWLMRTWGRLTGTGVNTEPSEKLDQAQTANMEAALKAAGQPVPRTKQGLLEKAREIAKANAAAFKQLTKEELKEPEATRRVKKTAADKTDLDRAADRYVLARDNGMVDAPRNGTQREWIKTVFRQALDQLKGEGFDLTPAAGQATIWNPEKVLMAHLGAITPPESDYAKALKAIADERGIKV